MILHKIDTNPEDDSRRKATEFASRLASNQEQDAEQPSLSASTSVLPKIGLALGGATLATLAWYSFSSRSENDTSSEGPYNISGSREDTEFYLDWSMDDRFNNIRPAHFEKAGTAFKTGKISLGFANLLTATAPLEIGAFDVTDTDGAAIIKFQLVRYVHAPTYMRDDIKPEEISYYLSLENIPGSPYSLNYLSRTDPNIKVFREGKHVAHLILPRDESGYVTRLYFVDLEGNEISQYNFAAGTKIEAIHQDFIKRSPTELANK